MNWQPIETAPKDGTVILGWWSPMPEGARDDPKCWALTRYVIDGWNAAEGDDEYGHPDFWMPLPPAPVAGQPEGNPAMGEAALPELPEPEAVRADWPDWNQYHDASDPVPDKWDDEVPTLTPLFSKAQVRTLILAERERCAEVVERFDACDPAHIAVAVRQQRFRAASTKGKTE